MNFSIKIPPCWVDKLEIFYDQIEAQFKINDITIDDTNFQFKVCKYLLLSFIFFGL